MSKARYRLHVRLLLTVAAIVAASVVAAPPASAAKLKGISIDAVEGARAQGVYPVGSIPGSDAGYSPSLFRAPATCATSPNCGLVPLTVNYPPGFDRTLQEFFLDVVISWDQGKVEVDTGRRVAGQDVRESAQGNDLDIYFYTKKPDPKDPNKMVDVELGRASTANMPEKFRLFGGFPAYDISVINYSGVNRGFTIDVTFVPAFIVAPFSGSEDDVPSFGSTSDGDNASSDGDGGGGFLDLTTPGPAFGSTSRGNAAPLLAPTGPADLAAVTGITGASPDEGAFGDADPSFSAALAGTRKSASSLFEEARTTGPPKPVPASLLVFWLVVVPLVLAVAAAIVFIRRRPMALSFDLSSAAPA